jgi:hypothetical protein
MIALRSIAVTAATSSHNSPTIILTRSRVEREKLRAQERAYRQRSFLTRKVAREWQVSLEEARAMIERGTFPP